MNNKISQIINDLFGVEASVVLTRPDEQFGDYSTNVALQLAKPLGNNPRQIASQIAEKLYETGEYDAVDVAGPGFINIRLSDKELLGMLDNEAVKTLDGKTVIVEYSDPNPFKPLHAGHLYTTLVGDAISRLVENAGAKTIRINYGGDVGLHVGKSMWAIIQYLGGEYPEKLADVPEIDRATWLGLRYVEGNNAYEDDGTAKQAIIETNKRVYKIHADNDRESAFAKVYWTTRQWSYQYFDVLYKQLEVKSFDRYIPESEVTPLGLTTVRQELKNGVYNESDGAVVFTGEKVGLHTRVFINSEGLPTYEAKDVGLSLTKWRDYGFDESIIITANEQAQYMQVVIASIEEFAPDPAQRTRHLTHGTVNLQGGEKMSSRKGNIVSALDILESARQAAAATGRDTSESTVLAAVKYAFSKNRIGGDIAYDPAESIALEGNSGPYLQYAHARARSVLSKSDQLARQPERLQPGERSLLRKLGEYQDTVAVATQELTPHHIAVYLYELAQAFNSFYEHNRVIGDDRQAERLWLVEQYANTLRDGLGLLGITAPDKM